MPSVRFECAQGNREYFGTAGGETIHIDRDLGIGCSSVEFLLLALGSCTVATMRNYMVPKGWPADGLGAELNCDLDEESNSYREIRIVLRFPKGLDTAQRKTLTAVAGTCRIHNTLKNVPAMRIELADPVG